MKKDKGISEDELRESRRKFILEKLTSRNRKVAYKELHEKFGLFYNDAKPKNRVPSASIQADIKALQEAGHPVNTIKIGRETVIILGESRSFTIYERKGIEEQEEKRKIAWLAAGVLAGLEVKQSKLMSSPHGLSDVPLRSEIESQILRAEALEEYPKLHEKLKYYWSLRRRAFALDSGTTNFAVALKIMDLCVPSLEFDQIECFTNNRLIFEKLGHTGCKIKTTILGGKQRHESSSICGTKAEQCLKVWDPFFSVSLIGATVFDTRRGVMGSYNDSEAKLKSELLERGALKIVVLDNTKFTNNFAGGATGFVSCNERTIDLIITDRLDGSYRDKLVEKFGVPILTASDLGKD